MDAVTPTTTTTLTCTLDLSISIPGSSSSSSSARDLNINRLIKRSNKRQSTPEDEKWININVGCLNRSEDITHDHNDIDTDSPYADHATRNELGSDNIQPPSKKLRLSKEQSRLLEESFRQHHTLNPRQKEELANSLKLRPRQVEVWFQNRRARSKLKQTEIECEYLKRWFGSLTERNQKLQKEVEELRAIKVGPVNVKSAHVYGPSITMCPRCERVSSTTMAYVERAV